MRDIFEKALFDNPDDLVTYHAYADWLLEQNDPRGEFMLTQLHLEQTSDEVERKNLRKRARELQTLHEEKWLGGLARILLGRGGEEFSHTFARGWLNTLTIRELRLTLAKTIARSPVVMLLRDLNIYSVPRAAPGRPLAMVALLASKKMVNLRAIRVDRLYHGDEVCRSLAESTQLRSLRSLSLKGAEIGAEGANFLLRWPGLRDLEWLDLSYNQIPQTKCDEILAILPHASVGAQVPPPREPTEDVRPDDFYDDDWE